jgi:hypothetical protein
MRLVTDRWSSVSTPFHHLLLRALKNPGVQTLFHQGPHLVLAHPGLGGIGSHPDQPQDAFGREFEDAQERGGQPCEHAHRAGQQAGDLFRVGQADALRDQFAEQQDEGREAEGHDDEGERRGGGGQPGRPGQPFAERTGQARAAEHAGDHAAEGQPEFHQRQEPGRIGGEGQGLPGRGVAGLGLAPELGLAGGDHGGFGHGQHSIGDHQQADHDDFERKAGHVVWSAR